MVQTNEFERDFNDTSFLKRPGRVDLRVLQNSADVGDGHPGLQRCFRNYLHEGGMEKDLDLIGYSIKGTSVDINNAELQQLSNIGVSIITGSIWSQLDNIESTTISAAQWVFVGGADQHVRQADSPTFVGLTLSANLITTSTIDGIDLSLHDHSGSDKGLNVPFTSLSGDIVYTQLDSIVDIAGEGGSALISRADHVHTAADGSSKVNHVNLLNKGSNTHTEIDTHLGSTANPHTVTAQQTFTANETVSVIAIKFTGANSGGNSIKIGPTNTMTLYHDGSNTGKIFIGANAHVGGGSNIFLETGGIIRWSINSSGNFQPYAGDTYDIGSAGLDVKTLYYCNLSDTSCADFSKMSADELYQTFAQIKPRTDNIRHTTKDMDFVHIDFSTLPDCFATKADKDFIKENVWEKIDGKLVKTTFDYKKGDNCGIEMGNMVYALKDLVVKSYEKIKKLETEIELLKSN